MNGLTAPLSPDLLKLAPGQVLAVTGAAGAYGGYVIELAKGEGLTVIADASDADEQLVTSLGADIVVRYGDGVAARIRRHFPEGVNGLADGAVLNERAIRLFATAALSCPSEAFRARRSRRSASTRPSFDPTPRSRKKLDRLRQQVESGGVRGRLVIQF